MEDGNEKLFTLTDRITLVGESSRSSPLVEEMLPVLQTSSVQTSERDRPFHGETYAGRNAVFIPDLRTKHIANSLFVSERDLVAFLH